MPRALWYGVEFIRYALNRAWFDREVDCHLRGYNVTKQFREHYSSFSKPTMRRLSYFAKYINREETHDIQLIGVYKSTTHDDDFPYYKSLAHQYLLDDDDHGGQWGLPLQGEEAPLTEAALLQQGYAFWVRGISSSEYQDYVTSGIAESMIT